MTWYSELSLGKKIVAGFLLVACLSGLSGILASLSIWNVGQRCEAMYTHNLLPISELAEVGKGYKTALTLMRDIVIDKAPQEQNEHLEKLKQAEAGVTKGLERFFAANRTPEALALQKTIDDDLKLYGFFRDKIVELAASDRRDEAVNIMRTQAADVTERLDDSIAKLVNLNKAQAHRHNGDNVAAARYALSVSVLFLALGLVAAFFMGYLTHLGISIPVRGIAEKLAAITAGDLTVRVDGASGDGTRNELHLLARNVDLMASTLQRMVAGIAGESHKLSLASQRLNGASVTMAQRAELTTTEIRTVAGASSEMNHTASEIAGNCATAAENVQSANDAVEQGARNMELTIASVRGIGEHARSTSQLIAQLAARSLQITEITETIDDIADQTNLLALNAAIEAARAGDQGRGFAVVADEVRALATRTTSATKEISAMIQAIQSETRQAMTAMERGVTEASQGAAMAENTGSWLEKVTASICSISMEVSHIATAAEEQSCTVDAITGNIRKVTEIVSDSAAGTQEFAAAASEMHLMAEDLQKIVGVFTIDAPGSALRRDRDQYDGRSALARVSPVPA